MKNFVFVLALLCANAFATDWGFVPLNTMYGLTATGEFSDTAQFQTTIEGPVTVRVSGYAATPICTGGRGANCRYNITGIGSIAITDGNGLSSCDPVHTIAYTTHGQPYDVWTCNAADLVAGTYTITVQGDAYTRTKISGSDQPHTEPYFVLVNGQ